MCRILYGQAFPHPVVRNTASFAYTFMQFRMYEFCLSLKSKLLTTSCPWWGKLISRISFSCSEYFGVAITDKTLILSHGIPGYLLRVVNGNIEVT